MDIYICMYIYICIYPNGSRDISVVMLSLRNRMYFLREQLIQLWDGRIKMESRFERCFKFIIPPFRCTWRHTVSHYFMSSLWVAENPQISMFTHAENQSADGTRELTDTKTTTEQLQRWADEVDRDRSDTERGWLQIQRVPERLRSGEATLNSKT